jgi:hypothetical protein
MVALAVWCQTFMVWVFVRAWRLLGSAEHYSKGIKALIIATIMEFVCLPFLVWAVVKFFVALLRPSRVVGEPQERWHKRSLVLDISCLVGMIAILALAIFLAVWGGVSLLPVVVSITLRIAFGLVVPGAVYVIVILTIAIARRRKEKPNQSTLEP